MTVVVAAAYRLYVRSSVLCIAMLAAAASLAACGGGSAKASRDCFEVWNTKLNQARQATVARRFTVADVSRWFAEPTGGGNLGGPASVGCAYLFHTSKRYLSISGEWKGRAISWGAPPTSHGSWSPQQQAAVRDNATVDADGLLSRRS